MPALVLTDHERRTLRRRLRNPATSLELRRRIRIVLACAGGLSNLEVAERLEIHRTTVGTWRSRFLEWRLEGLGDQPHPGAPRIISDAQVERVIVTTLESVREDRACWSARALARQVGMSSSAVGRIWEAFGLHPRMVEIWKRRNDPRSIDGAHNLVGLYLNPPEAVIVVSAEERSPCAAAVQPAPPQRPGVPPPDPGNGHRQAGCDLDSVIEMAASGVAPRMTPWQRVLAFFRFLRRVDQLVPTARSVHLILGVCSTYTAPVIRRWLVDHPRFHLHFSTADSSWTGLLRRWLGELAVTGPGQPDLTAELALSLERWIEASDGGPRPFGWINPARAAIAAMPPEVDDEFPGRQGRRRPGPAVGPARRVVRRRDRL